MKILFLSDEPGTNNCINMSALASSIALHFPVKSYVMQHKSDTNTLERIFTSQDVGSVREESSYYALKGMDYLMWQEENNRLDRNSIDESFVSAFDNHLFYLPSGKRSMPLLNAARTGELEGRIIDKMDEFGDFIFIDGGQSADLWPRELIERSDLIVIGLSQSKLSLDKYFVESNLLRRFPKDKKIMYLLSGYSAAEVYNIGNISRIYRLDEKDMLMVPSNEYFAQACRKGKLPGFMEKNTRKFSLGNCEYFMNEVHKSSLRIMEALSMYE